MRALIVTLFLAVAPIGTAAAQVPYFDIAGYCRGIADGSYLVETGCRKNEEDARRKLSMMTIPDRVLRHCRGVIDDSYSVLHGCIVSELGAKAHIPQGDVWRRPPAGAMEVIRGSERTIIQAR